MISEQTLANQFRLLTAGVRLGGRSPIAHFLSDSSSRLPEILDELFKKFPLNVAKKLLFLAKKNMASSYKPNQKSTKMILDNRRKMVLQWAVFFNSILSHKGISLDDKKKQKPILMQLHNLAQVFSHNLSMLSYIAQVFSRNSALENAIQPLLNGAVNWGINLTDQQGLETLQALADHAKVMLVHDQSSLRGMRLFHHVCEAYFLSGKTTSTARVDRDAKHISKPRSLIDEIAAFNQFLAGSIAPHAFIIEPIIAAMYTCVKQNNDDPSRVFDLYFKHLKVSHPLDKASSKSESKERSTYSKIDAILLLIKHCGQQRNNLRWLLYRYPSTLTDEDELSKVCDVLVMVNRDLALHYKDNLARSLLRHSPHRSQLRKKLVDKLKKHDASIEKRVRFFISMSMSFYFSLLVCLDEKDGVCGRVFFKLSDPCDTYRRWMLFQRPEIQAPLLRYIRSRSDSVVKTFLEGMLSEHSLEEVFIVLMVKGREQQTTYRYLLADCPHVLGFFFSDLQHLFDFFQLITSHEEGCPSVTKFAAASLDLLNRTPARYFKADNVPLLKDPLFLAAVRSTAVTVYGKTGVNAHTVLSQLLLKRADNQPLSEAKAVTLLHSVVHTKTDEGSPSRSSSNGS